MLRVLGVETRLCDGISRREVMRLGGIGALSLWGGAYLDAHALASPIPSAASLIRNPQSPTRNQKARSVIVFSLWGGPAHQDTLDLKPDAPAEIRGEFAPIETNVSGLQICEYLPRLARIAHLYAV